MASNVRDNAFVQEKEDQRLICDKTVTLIKNILSGAVMPGLKRVGFSDKQAISVFESLHTNHVKLESLKTTLTRKKMKVTIFGPTSSGKSTVINAMLGKDLLVCGSGQTTNCFLTIEQTVDNNPGHGSVTESHFIIRSSGARWSSDVKARATSHEENVKHPLDKQILHNLSDATMLDERLDVSFNIEVFLARYDHRCPLLSHYLQIVDCPGIGMCQDLGDRVKDYCGDADVHVLIVNSRSGITVEDKKHFLRVKERLPKPEIIIGFTQCDLSANENQAREERVRKQQLMAAFELLQSTGTAINMEEATERCFFISGYEALNDALREQVKYVNGQPERRQAFHDFKRKIEERASIAGKKAKLEGNRQACQNILTSCLRIISKLKDWICKRSNELVDESVTIDESSRKFDIQIKEFQRESEIQRGKALSVVEEELMDCMDTVIRKMKNALATTNTNIKAFDSDIHEHGVNIVYELYAKITKSCRRTTRLVCEEYTEDLLGTYKKCFQEFPHEYPKAYIEAVHEQLFPPDNNSNESNVPSKEKVDDLLQGVTDKGLIAMFATTRKRAKDVDVQNSSSRKDSQRMAAGASILFLRIRRWLMAAVDSQLLEKFEVERMEGFDKIKESCKITVEKFCESTGHYYEHHITNALLYLHKSDERKQRLKDLHDLGQLVIDYRNEAKEIISKLGMEDSYGYILVT